MDDVSYKAAEDASTIVETQMVEGYAAVLENIHKSQIRTKAVENLKRANEYLEPKNPEPKTIATVVSRVVKPKADRHRDLVRINLVLVGINLTLLAFIFYSIVL